MLSELTPSEFLELQAFDQIEPDHMTYQRHQLAIIAAGLTAALTGKEVDYTVFMPSTDKVERETVMSPNQTVALFRNQMTSG